MESKNAERSAIRCLGCKATSFRCNDDETYHERRDKERADENKRSVESKEPAHESRVKLLVVNGVCVHGPKTLVEKLTLHAGCLFIEKSCGSVIAPVKTV